MPLDAAATDRADMGTRWVNSAQIPPLADGDIHVWLVELEGEPEEASRAYLSDKELERAARFKFDRHRDEFIKCRGALRSLLGGYLGRNPADIELANGPKGKPHLSGQHAGSLHFNVSHSGEYALIGFSGSEIGVDIELQDPQFIERGTLEICLSPGESKAYDMLSSDDQVSTFFDTWTAKEAYLKLDGEGLAIEPNLIDLNFSGRDLTQVSIAGREVYFTRTPDVQGYSAAVAQFSPHSIILFHTFSAVHDRSV